jgi:hypothetical protein
MVDLYRLTKARIGLVAGLDRRQWAHSTSYAAEMAWISASWHYILSNPLVVSGGEVLRVFTTVASVWSPSRLTGGATSLARA